MSTTIKPAFPDAVLSAAQQHALWEKASALCSDQHTAAENLTWQLGTFSRLVQEATAPQPRLRVRLTSFPESNGKRNWTALLVREEPWDGLVGNCGGISLARGELWNRVAYEAEQTRFLIGERDTEPSILDYGDDIKTPEEWKGECDTVPRRRRIQPSV